jgi:hypothetical protein
MKTDCFGDGVVSARVGNSVRDDVRCVHLLSQVSHKVEGEWR